MDGFTPSCKSTPCPVDRPVCSRIGMDKEKWNMNTSVGSRTLFLVRITVRRFCSQLRHAGREVKAVRQELPAGSRSLADMHPAEQRVLGLTACRFTSSTNFFTPRLICEELAEVVALLTCIPENLGPVLGFQSYK
jgi:DNA-directed RNA polymerase specialized sigma24 family protein